MAVIAFGAIRPAYRHLSALSKYSPRFFPKDEHENP